MGPFSGTAGNASSWDSLEGASAEKEAAVQHNGEQLWQNILTAQPTATSGAFLNLLNLLRSSSRLTPAEMKQSEQSSFNAPNSSQG